MFIDIFIWLANSCFDYIEEKMRRYDLHVHTYYSRCSNLKPSVILAKAKKKKLNGIAITDHNTIKGALEVAKLNKDPSFEVIIGEEISTDKGEILGLYLKKEIKPGDFYSVVKEIKKQKGIAVIAHPYATLGVTRKKADADVFEKVDAIEGFNSRAKFKFENLRSQIKAKELDMAMTGGSDAHFRFEIARAYTEFDGNLRDAIKQKKTKIFGSNLYAIPGGLMTAFYKYFWRLFFRS